MTTLPPPAKIDNAAIKIHVHGLDEACQQLAPYIQMRYVQLQPGGACFHGAVARMGNALVGRVGADRDKVEFIEVPRGRTLIITPTRGLARLGTTSVKPGDAMIAHGPNQLAAYTDREYRALFASLPDCWNAKQVNPPAIQDAPKVGARVTVLRLSESESRMFHRYVHGGLEQQSGEAMSPVSDALVSLCDSWLSDLASREPGAGLSTARCHAAIRAREYIDEHLDEPLTLASVCHASYSSPRALEYGFREIFGVPPITYIRCARLSRVRRELCLSTEIYGRVTQLAMKWGFWHLSQFSSDYYELFGELPSTTLALSRVRSTAQRGFDGGDDLVRRTGLRQHRVEEL